MPSFEQDHEYLLELSHIFELTSQYLLDYTFASIHNGFSSYKKWEEEIDGPIPSEAVDCTPKNWYTQYWFNCVLHNINADLDGYEFHEICDNAFGNYDETIYTGHFLDLY